MPQKQYTVQAPDGRTVTLEGPEGASDQEVLAQAQKLLGSQPSAPVEPAKPMSFMDIIKRNVGQEASEAFTAAKDLGTGALQSLGNLARNQTVPTSMGPVRLNRPPEQALTPQNPAQSIGKLSTDVAQFMLPGATIPRAGNLLMRAGQAAVESGLITAGQTADPKATITSAVTAGVIPLAVPAFASALKTAGTKIQNVALRPKEVDKANGFLITNVFKHKVGGSPADVVTKTGAKIEALAKELHDELAKTPQAEIDFLGVLNSARDDVVKNASKTFGKNKVTLDAFNKLLDELVILSPKTGKVSLEDAQHLKRSLGLIGSWLNGAHDPESQGMERAATVLYSKVRQAIENTAMNGTRINEINKAIGELIPIEQVAAKSLTIAERNQAIGLLDTLGLIGGLQTPKAFWLPVVSRLAKSGKVGNALVQQSPSLTGTTAAPLAGAAGGMMTSRDRYK